MNPFVYGNPVDSDQFINRLRPLRRVVSRLRQRGQSTAIIGEPKSGKTSLLQYIAAPENASVLFGAERERMLFSFIDIQLLGGQVTPAGFWQHALEPVQDILGKPDSPLAQQFALCQQNDFGVTVLEDLLSQMNEESWQLVLLLDEFDTLINHPILNSAEFFGGLRSLTSRSRGSLAIVIASRISLLDMEGRTRDFKPIGSPYFNIFSTVTLSGFPQKDIDLLLHLGEEFFSPDDRDFIQILSGGHPFLLQLAAFLMYEAYEEELEAAQRYQQVSRLMQQETRLHFSDSWNSWNPAYRKAITAVALNQASRLLEGHKFNAKTFLKDLAEWSPELDDLEARGLIARNEKLAGGWQVEPYAFIWWLADELVRQVRDDAAFEGWVRAQEMTGPGGLTNAQMSRMGNFAKSISSALGRGASTLVDSLAKNFAEGTVKGFLP